MPDDDQEVITVQNQLSYFDLLTLRGLPFAPVPRLLTLAGFGALIGLGLSCTYTDIFWKLVVITGFSIYFVFLEFFAAWSIYKRTAKNTTAAFELRPDAIYATTEEGLKSKVGWQNVIRIEQKFSAIAIQISKKPDLYYWFPLRRFRSSADAEHFLTKANQYWTDWLMTASLESTKAAEETSEHPSVDVDITLKELIICDMFLLRHIVIWGLVLMAFGAVQAFFMWIGYLVMFASVIVIFAPVLGAIAKIKNQPNMLTGHTSITEEGIRPYNSYAGHDTVVSWKSIERIYTRHGLLFFELMNRRAVVVPLRCFKTEVAADNFVYLAQKEWSLHRTKSLEPGDSP